MVESGRACHVNTASMSGLLPSACSPMYSAATYGVVGLSETYRNVVQKLHLSRLTNLSHGLGMQASVADHREIAAALRAGDARYCEQLLADHVDRAHQRLVAHKDSNQGD